MSMCAPPVMPPPGHPHHPPASSRPHHGAPGTVALEVSDVLGFAEGRWLLTVDAEGTGPVTAWEGEAPDGAVTVALGVEELSAVYLGGVSLATSLARPVGCSDGCRGRRARVRLARRAAPQHLVLIRAWRGRGSRLA